MFSSKQIIVFFFKSSTQNYIFFQNLSVGFILKILLKLATPRHLKDVFSKFIGKDEAFVEDWLIRQGLDKLVDVFKSIFSQFKIFLHYL